MGLRILLIDDDKDFVPALAEFLEELGHTVRLVDEWVKVFPALREFAPDVALVDLKLPSIRGEDIVIALKRVTRIPVFIHSASSTDELEAARRLSKADGVVRKGRPRDLAAQLGQIAAERVAAAIHAS